MSLFHKTWWYCYGVSGVTFHQNAHHPFFWWTLAKPNKEFLNRCRKKRRGLAVLPGCNQPSKGDSQEDHKHQNNFVCNTYVVYEDLQRATSSKVHSVDSINYKRWANNPTCMHAATTSENTIRKSLSLLSHYLIHACNAVLCTIH